MERKIRLIVRRLLNELIQDNEDYEPEERELLLDTENKVQPVADIQKVNQCMAKEEDIEEIPASVSENKTPPF